MFSVSLQKSTGENCGRLNPFHSLEFYLIFITNHQQKLICHLRLVIGHDDTLHKEVRLE